VDIAYHFPTTQKYLNGTQAPRLVGGNRRWWRERRSSERILQFNLNTAGAVPGPFELRGSCFAEPRTLHCECPRHDEKRPQDCRVVAEEGSGHEGR